MKQVAVSVAVALALFGAFVYGVEFGRKVEHDAQVNAKEASATSSYQTYDTYSGSGQYECEFSKDYTDYSRE